MVNQKWAEQTSWVTGLNTPTPTHMSYEWVVYTEFQQCFFDHTQLRSQVQLATLVSLKKKCMQKFVALYDFIHICTSQFTPHIAV